MIPHADPMKAQHESISKTIEADFITVLDASVFWLLPVAFSPTRSMGHDHCDRERPIHIQLGATMGSRNSDAQAQTRMSIFFSDVDATDSYCNNLFVPSATFEIHACDLQALWQEESGTH